MGREPSCLGGDNNDSETGSYCLFPHTFKERIINSRDVDEEWVNNFVAWSQGQVIDFVMMDKVKQETRAVGDLVFVSCVYVDKDEGEPVVKISFESYEHNMFLVMKYQEWSSCIRQQHVALESKVLPIRIVFERSFPLVHWN